MNPLFSRIADFEAYLEARPEEKAAVVTPTQRLSRNVREAVRRHRLAARSVVTDIPVMPLKQYWLMQAQRAITRGEIEPHRVLSSFAQRKLWQEIIEQNQRDGFTLLHPSKAAELCMQADERLLLWLSDPNSRELSQYFAFEDDASAFLRWRKVYEDRLGELNFTSPERLLGHLLTQRLESDGHKEILIELYFDELAPLFEKLHATAKRRCPILIGKPRATVEKPQTFNTRLAELQSVARWCHGQVQKNPASRIAVVLSDLHAERDTLEYLLRREFGHLTNNYTALPANFSTGFPLVRVPLVRDALRCLASFRTEVPVELILALLQSRFVSAPSKLSEHGEHCVQGLRALAVESVPQRVLRALLSPLWDGKKARAPWDQITVLEAQEGVFRSAFLPSRWALLFPKLLSAWDWGQGSSLDSLEYQQLERWQRSLDAFAQLDLLLGSLRYDAALAALESLIGEEDFQPETGDQPIQILGPLETIGLEFDALWITGMASHRWPDAPRPNPYLPHRLQVSAGMPRCDSAWEWRQAQARWSSWCASTSSVQPSYLAQEDDIRYLPSPLLSSTTAITQADSPAHEHQSDPRWIEQYQQRRLDSVELSAIPLLAEEAASKSVSSQLFAAQVGSPFQAFAEWRLGVRVPSVLFAGLHPAEKGTVMHRALYEVYCTITSSESLADTEEGELALLIRGAVSKALQSLNVQRREILGPRILDLERERVSEQLADWLALEKTRPIAFVVEACEREAELKLGPLTVKLRLDRVDRLADGTRFLIDYKTGATESTKRWFEAPLTSTQLPIYAQVEPFADGLAFASLKRGAMGFSGVAECEIASGVKLFPSYEELEQVQKVAIDTPAKVVFRQFWRSELEQIAREFADGLIDDSVEKNSVAHAETSTLVRRPDR
ncbi:MAG: PD-(D/E)XK nuclease family protein [Pseudomonadota bacterium]